jgi:hypothetical protein
MTGAGLLAAVTLASSCSLDATVATDTSGRVIGINALRIQSVRSIWPSPLRSKVSSSSSCAGVRPGRDHASSLGRFPKLGGNPDRV